MGKKKDQEKAPPPKKELPKPLPARGLLSDVKHQANFLQALEEGMTFLEACEYSDNDPAFLTGIIKRHPAFYTHCKLSARKSVEVYLNLAGELAGQGLYHKSLEARRSAKIMSGPLNLWGSAGLLKEMTTDQVLRMLRQTTNQREVACSLGVTHAELEAYLEDHDLFDVLERISRKRSW